VAHALSILPPRRHSLHAKSLMPLDGRSTVGYYQHSRVRTIRRNFGNFRSRARTACERCGFAARVHLAGAPPSVRCTWGPTGKSHGHRDIHSSTLSNRKCNMVGHWAPTNKSPVFGAWLERHSVRQVRLACIAPTTIVQSTIS
jgi:hypothetical protein